MSRVSYYQALADLRTDLLTLGERVATTISAAMDALPRRDVAAARDLIAADAEINETRWRIEERALTLIATQAPMAGDLRAIAAVIQIAAELEQMADHAVNIARLAIATAGGDERPIPDGLVRMAELAGAMLGDSLVAFRDADVAAARAIAERDDAVDREYRRVSRLLLEQMLASPATIDRATRLLRAAHNLERVADRATNICERVIFAVEGRGEHHPDPVGSGTTS